MFTSYFQRCVDLEKYPLLLEKERAEKTTYRYVRALDTGVMLQAAVHALAQYHVPLASNNCKESVAL